MQSAALTSGRIAGIFNRDTIGGLITVGRYATRGRDRYGLITGHIRVAVTISTRSYIFATPKQFPYI